MKLTHIRLLVPDYAACFRFYRDVIGFEVHQGVEEGVYAEFKAGGILLAIYPRAMMADVAGTSGFPDQADTQDPMCLTFEVEDVDAVAQRVESAGVPLVAPPTDREVWFLRTAHFRDPAGNLIEINAPFRPG